ncbi:MAG TPA: nicotinic acid mononucleotide adenylyltransferase, partial [Rhodocyclaceae bacterium]|nr:nicotinic acid mononucleotide adenylyltransferase [Rhodocyclaceae bacterium]
LAAGAMDPALGEEFGRRQASPAALAATPAGAIVPFPLVAGTVSATEVRTVLGQDGDARELLPPAVVDYIFSHALYRPHR